MNLVGKLEEYMIFNWYRFSILIPYIMGASTKKTYEIKYSLYITKCLIKSRTNQEYVIERFFPSWIRDRINIIKKIILICWYICLYLLIFWEWPYDAKDDIWSLKAQFSKMIYNINIIIYSYLIIGFRSGGNIFYINERK